MMRWERRRRKKTRSHCALSWIFFFFFPICRRIFNTMHLASFRLSFIAPLLFDLCTALGNTLTLIFLQRFKDFHLRARRGSEPRAPRASSSSGQGIPEQERSARPRLQETLLGCGLERVKAPRAGHGDAEPPRVRWSPAGQERAGLGAPSPARNETRLP